MNGAGRGGRSTTLAARLAAQGLSGSPLPSPELVVERLLAVQGQDPRGARLAVRARSSGISAADVDTALSEHRSLLISWLNRGTLHLVRSEDYPWLQELSAPRSLAANARRLRQEGVDEAAAERGVATIGRALAEEGPLTRLQLRDRLERAAVPTAGQALVHLLMLASLRGLVVRGPMVGRQHAFVLVRDWLGEQRRPDRNSALAELARRYLAGHGPAGERDLARWAGLPLRDARAALGQIATELRQVEGGLVDLASRSKGEAELPPPRLLGPFDPSLHGWIDREAITGPHNALITTNGLFRPFAMVEGRAVATWRIERQGVRIEPLEPFDDGFAEPLEAEAEDVRRFLALP